MIDRKQFTQTRTQPTDYRVSKLFKKKTNLIITHFPFKGPPTLPPPLSLLCHWAFQNHQFCIKYF